MNQIKKQNISTKNRKWHRFNAIDGANYNTVQSETDMILTDPKSKQKALSYWKKNPGSIGCYLSHIKLWKHISDTGEEYSLILEDDSFFTPIGMINIELALNSAKKMKWDILYVGHNLLKGYKIHPLFVRPYITKKGENNRGYNSGLFGYIIRKSSIPKLLQIISSFDSPFVDVQIRNNFGDGPKKISALFTTHNLIKHNNIGLSRRKYIDNFIKNKKI